MRGSKKLVSMLLVLCLMLGRAAAGDGGRGC